MTMRHTNPHLLDSVTLVTVSVVHRRLITDDSHAPVYVCIDSAYFDADSYDHIIPTAWIPLLDVNSDNGTLQVSTTTTSQLNLTQVYSVINVEKLWFRH